MLGQREYTIGDAIGENFTPFSTAIDVAFPDDAGYCGEYKVTVLTA
jgi:predicted nucleotide-binding protein